MENKKFIKTAVYVAILTCLAFILNFIQIPYILPWLKIEISEVITLLATSISVYVALLVAIIKGILMMLTGTTSGLIGEITLIMSSIIIICSYTLFNKALKLNKIISLTLMSIIFIVSMTILNYFFITPFYFGMTWQDLAKTQQNLNFINHPISYLDYILIVYIPFNTLKIFIDSLIFYFLSNKLDIVLKEQG